jgi:hypothetical protein
LKEAPCSLDAALKVAKTALIARTARTDLMDNSCVMRIEEERDQVTNQLNEFRLQIDGLQKQQIDFFKRFEASSQQQNFQTCFTNQGPMLAQKPPDSRQTNTSNYIATIVCYACGKHGHIARECQSSSRTNSLNFSGRRN